MTPISDDGPKPLSRSCFKNLPKEEFGYTLQWTVNTRENSLAQGCTSEQFKDIQEKMSLIHGDFAEYIHHVGYAYEMHSNIRSGLIPGGRSNRKNRQSVFFTAVNPIDIQPDRTEVEYDVNRPRIAQYNKLGDLIKIQLSIKWFA